MTAAETRGTPLTRLPTNVWFVGQTGHERQRGGRYHVDAIRAHPGKMLPEIAQRIIDRYTQPGDWILDPLSGIGTTGVEAVHHGRNYVGIELEAPFVQWQRQHLIQARRGGAKGIFSIFHHDARRLAEPKVTHRLTRAATRGPITAVITSPPYGDRLRQQPNPSRQLREMLRAGTVKQGILPKVYGTGPVNLGNLHGKRYWHGMRQVYQGCFEVLKPGGWLVVVIQPERRGHTLDPLHHDTVRVCQELGFEYVDEILAVTGRVETPTSGEVQLVPHASFWRRLRVVQLNEAGWPLTLHQVEYVLVFRKPELAPAPVLVRTATVSV